MKILTLKMLGFVAMLVFFNASFASTTFISKNSTWKFKDDGSDQGTNWKNTNFNDASWSSGAGVFGFGTLDGATITTSLTVGAPQATTYYFRKSFTLANATYSGGINLNLLCDDGAVIYINGKEAYRYNMPTGSITYTTNASSAIGSTDEGDYTTYNVDDSFLVVGTNYIAVELHQVNSTSSDVGFDLEVVGSSGFNLTNGPYLNMARTNGINVRWRTSNNHQARVWYGTAIGNLNNSASQNIDTTEHEVAITGLSANTKYYYAIGTTSGDTIQSGSLNYFITSPIVGSEKATRIWVLGDCGRATTLQSNTRDAYYNYTSGTNTDFVMLLGDNAYSSGTDNEYETKFFEYYDQDILKHSPLFPCPGNHDYNNGGTTAMNIPYYKLFTLPTNAECGGIASNTEAYYSYDYANIHFVSLDSYGEESNKKMYDTTSAQSVWLKNDLAATTQKWKVLYWHHPPYTKGSHNSDTESDLIAVRELFLRMIERYDVDLILCGHSHNYERSKMIKGHYGAENTYSDGAHAVSTSSGKYDGSSNSCPYTKTSTDHQGTVYVVAGAASASGTTTSGYPHNAMYYSESAIGGTAVLDINGTRLDLKYIDKDGNVLDSFTMMKDVNKKTSVSLSGSATQEISASWPGAASWCNSATTTAITVDSTSKTYIVTDGKSCLADTFIVNNGGACAPSSGGNNAGNTYTGPKTIAGDLFLDFGLDGLFTPNTDKFGAGVVAINVYKDLDSNGIVAKADLLKKAYTNAFGEYSITLDSLPSILNYSVTAGADDAEENIGTSAVDVTSSDLEITYDGFMQYPAVRFNNINLAPGDSIISAYITFTAKDAGNSTAVFTNIYGFKTDASGFSNSTGNISGRTKITTNARWPASGNLPTWSANATYQTTDLKAIVQEIVAENSWETGNSLGFVLVGTGTGIRRAWSYDGNSNGAPALFIQVYRGGTANVLPSHVVVKIDQNGLGNHSKLSTDSAVSVKLAGAQATTTIDFGYLGPRTQCMIVSDGSTNGTSTDVLYVSNRFTGDHMKVGDISAFNIEACGLMLGMDTLYTVDGDQFGYLDMRTGVFQSIGSAMGTMSGVISGSNSTRNISDVDGLTYDAINNILWALERRAGAGENDLLFQINRTTGSFVPNAFGAGVDFVEIKGNFVKDDVDDLAFDPITQTMYAVNNENSGDSSRLITINVSSGIATVVGTNGLADVEGMGHYNTGELYGTTGTNNASGSSANSFYALDRSTGFATEIQRISPDIDYEGCDCFSGPGLNYLSGKVFWDKDSSGSYNPGDTSYSGIKLVLILDVNENGVIDAGDTRVDSMNSNNKGDYAFLTYDLKKYLISPIINGTVINGLKTTTNDSLTEFATFTSYGQFDPNNDFGFHSSAGQTPFIPLPVTWLFVNAEWQNENALITWATASEQNNDYFEIQRLNEEGKFISIGTQTGAGNAQTISKYSYLDFDAFNNNMNKLYYRLKQVDLNGNYDFSNVVAISKNRISDNMKVYPNPFKDNISITFEDNATGAVYISITDITGKIVYQNQVTKLEGQNHISIEKLGLLPAGLYVLQLESHNKATSIRLVKTD